MKLRIEVDGESYLLQLQPNGSVSDYTLEGTESASGKVSVAEIRPGVFSLLLDGKSLTAYTAMTDAGLEVWTGTQRHLLSIADARDKSPRSKKAVAAGPLEIKAQMPGKVVKLLIASGESVRAGQGVIVVEAMKMQNEMKSPKDGVISHIRVQEGATVAAGETMMVIE